MRIGVLTLCLGTVLLGLSGCATKPVVATNRPLAEMKYIDMRGDPYLKLVSINKKPVEFLMAFDSGTKETVFFETEKANTLLRYPVSRMYLRGQAGGKEEIKPITLHVHPRLKEKKVLDRTGTPYADFDGILGSDLFRAYSVVVKPRQKLLQFYKPDTTLPGFSYVPLEYNSYFQLGYIYADISVNKGEPPVRTQLLVDTGLAFDLSLQKESNPAFSKINAFRKQRVMTSYGVKYNEVGKVSGIRIGDIFNEHDVEVMLSYDLGNWKEAYGILGWKQMKNYDIHIDFKGGRLGFAPLTDGKGQPSN